MWFFECHWVVSISSYCIVYSHHACSQNTPLARQSCLISQMWLCDSVWIQIPRYSSLLHWILFTSCKAELESSGAAWCLLLIYSENLYQQCSQSIILDQPGVAISRKTLMWCRSSSNTWSSFAASCLAPMTTFSLHSRSHSYAYCSTSPICNAILCFCHFCVTVPGFGVISVRFCITFSALRVPFRRKL